MSSADLQQQQGSWAGGSADQSCRRDLWDAGDHAPRLVPLRPADASSVIPPGGADRCLPAPVDAGKRAAAEPAFGHHGLERWTGIARNLVRYGGPLVTVLLFAAALGTLHRELAGHQLGDIISGLHAIPASVLLGAAALTVFSYIALAGYDVLALRYVGRRLPYSKLGLASFLGFTFSHNLGLGLITGGGRFGTGCTPHMDFRRATSANSSPSARSRSGSVSSP